MTDDASEVAPTPEQLARDARATRRLDLLVAGFFLLIGLVALQQVWAELPLLNRGQVGPGMLPFGIGCILVAMSLTLIWQNLRGRAATGGLAMPTLDEGSRVAAVVAMLVAVIALIPMLGTLVTLALFIFAELKFVERRSLVLSLATALLIPLFIYAAFEALLGVALPAGTLGLL